MGEVDPRAARSRRAITAAATTLFLEQGYTATTMDDIAAAAPVSKRTVYNNFPDKESLFREVVLAATGLADDFVDEAMQQLAAARAGDLRPVLVDLAEQLAEIVTSARVLQLRRLVIGEAHRFPDLAAEYYRRAPGKVLAALAAAFAELDRRRLLRAPDPVLAAEQFAALTFGEPLDRSLFHHGHDARIDPARLRGRVAAGVATFLAAHSRRTSD